MLTTDPNHPGLTKGVDVEPTEQAPVYLVLSDEERSKGFIRPYRDSYRHVGEQPKNTIRSLTPEELTRYSKYGYVAFEAYPDRDSSVTGRYWTQQQLDNRGCGSVTTMGRALSETYARDPKFYGATYCCRCQMHRPVAEFVWEADGQVVGS